jgi:hypothetical protein
MTATSKKSAQHLAVARAIADGCDSLRLICARTGLDVMSGNNSVRALLDKGHLGRSRGINGNHKATYWLTSSMAEIEASFAPQVPTGYQAWQWQATELERAWPARVARSAHVAS